MDAMHLKSWAMVGFFFVAGAAAVWRLYGRRRRGDTASLTTERIRNAGRLVAGGGVRRIT